MLDSIAHEPTDTATWDASRVCPVENKSYFSTASVNVLKSVLSFMHYTGIGRKRQQIGVGIRCKGGAVAQNCFHAKFHELAFDLVVCCIVVNLIVLRRV